MYALTITFGQAGTSWRLLFQTEEKAHDAAKCFQEGMNSGELCYWQDDFGQFATISGAIINGIMLEDLDRSKIGVIEFNLHQARTQASLNQRVEGDPTLRAARAMQRPAMINPMGGSLNG